jgi:hypothetical protein
MTLVLYCIRCLRNTHYEKILSGPGKKLLPLKDIFYHRVQWTQRKEKKLFVSLLVSSRLKKKNFKAIKILSLSFLYVLQIFLAIFVKRTFFPCKK